MKTILSVSDKWNDWNFLNLELKFCSCPQINRPLNAAHDLNIEGNISEALLFNSSYSPMLSQMLIMLFLCYHLGFTNTFKSVDIKINGGTVI